jgi:hypothetical protein
LRMVVAGSGDRRAEPSDPREPAVGVSDLVTHRVNASGLT